MCWFLGQIQYLRVYHSISFRYLVLQIALAKNEFFLISLPFQTHLSKCQNLLSIRCDKSLFGRGHQPSKPTRVERLGSCPMPRATVDDSIGVRGHYLRRMEISGRSNYWPTRQQFRIYHHGT